MLIEWTTVSAFHAFLGACVALAAMASTMPVVVVVVDTQKVRIKDAEGMFACVPRGVSLGLEPPPQIIEHHAM